MVIASGITVIFCVFFQRETYGPFILYQKKKRLQKDKPHIQYRTNFEMEPKKLFRRSITRPLGILFTSPICSFMSLFLSLIYGVLYPHLITIALLFNPTPLDLFSYHWTHGTVGLAYLGAGVGSILGTLICAKFLNGSYASAAARHEKRTGTKNAAIPEFRLPFMQVGMAIVPAGLIIFAWSAEKQTHWIVPMLGACIFGLGMLMGYVCIHTYLADAFERFAASALAAAIVTRCVTTFVCTVVGFELHRRLGFGW
jgi:MFS family permease